MKKAAIFLIFLVVPVFSFSAPILKGSVKVEQSIDAFVDSADHTGTLVLVEREGQTSSFAKGWRDREEKTPAQKEDLFEIGSASKMFTAIAILQLTEAGKLSLSDKVSEFFPEEKYQALANYKGSNFWQEITVAMLLNHTSGMIDYLNVYVDDQLAMDKLAIKGKVYTPDELFQLAIDHGDANFKPGAQFKYCNTGYIMLGELISKVSGMPWRKYIAAHIFVPTDMRDTWFGSTMPASAVKRTMASQFNRKASFMPPTLAGPAGEMVSNLNDLQKFLHAWQAGKLFKNLETLQLQRSEGFHIMPHTGGKLTYGYGVMKVMEFYGHAGQTFGFQSYVAMNPKSKVLCIVGVNDASVPAMNLFMQVVK